MSQAKNIQVTTSELKSAANHLRQCAQDYSSLYNEVLGKTSDLASSWQEIDSQTYRDKVASFRSEFIKMKDEIERYADFLDKTAGDYEAGQKEAFEQAKALIGGRG